MQGAKAYVLPAVAAAVVLASWVWAPSLETDGTGDVSEPPDVPPTPATDARAQRLDEIHRALAEIPVELPEAYQARQRTLLTARMADCELPPSARFEVTIVAAPGHPGLVERITASSSVPAATSTCVREALLDARLPAAPSPGRSVVGLGPEGR